MEWGGVGWGAGGGGGAGAWMMKRKDIQTSNLYPF